jgi:hypothetical protein
MIGGSFGNWMTSRRGAQWFRGFEARGSRRASRKACLSRVHEGLLRRGASSTLQVSHQRSESRRRTDLNEVFMSTKNSNTMISGLTHETCPSSKSVVIFARASPRWFQFRVVSGTEHIPCLLQRSLPLDPPGLVGTEPPGSILGFFPKNSLRN